ncbi:hypothetical protein [Streptomyces arenae]|uniref:hypothetical protein n=1 Tax=Streptomyces arenae TaxID=29301 RepID=UPI002658CC81|nr:hypothetical protein [Streptomyces arenae]MCG7207379.1 hypothetical protein [Streptomyces arenae]
MCPGVLGRVGGAMVKIVYWTAAWPRPTRSDCAASSCIPPPASSAVPARLHLRITAIWPWRHTFATVFTRLHALPRPVT